MTNEAQVRLTSQRAFVRQQVMGLGHEVYIIDDRQGMPLRQMYIEPGAPDESFSVRWVERDRYADSSDIKPTLVLPPGVLELIMGAAPDTSRNRSVLQEALDDTRGVRDRLLSVVEGVAARGGIT